MTEYTSSDPILRSLPVFFIDASSPNTIAATFQDIAEYYDVGKSVEAAKRYFLSLKSSWLLILDNADDSTFDLGRFIPSSKHANVIITSRNSDVRVHASPGAVIDLTGLEPQDAISLLLRHANVTKSKKTCVEALEIVKELGFLALAVCSAGSYIARWCSLTDYLTRFKQHRRQLLDSYSGQVANSYPRSVRTIWSLTYSMLNEPCKHLLQILSFFNYSSIPESIFRLAARPDREIILTSDEKHPYPEIRAHLHKFFSYFCDEDGEWDSFLFEGILAELQTHSLIRYDRVSRTCSLHPLLHACAYDSHDPEELFQHRHVALEIICRSMPLGDTVDDYAFRRELYVHAKHWYGLFDDKTSVDSLTKGVLCRLAKMMEENGDYNTAVRIREVAVEADIMIHGEEHPDTLISKTNLASTYRVLGRFHDAAKLEVPVLAIKRRVFGEEHPSTLSSMDNLALTYNKLGSPHNAEKLEVSVLGIRRRTLGEEHPETLISMGVLAFAYGSMGRFNDAEKLEASALAIGKRIFGEEHPETLTLMSNLASTYRLLGRFEDAEKLGLATLTIQRRVLGDEHPHTLFSVGNLASTYGSLGRFNEAEKLEVAALAVLRRVLGNYHPSTLALMSNLALTYRSMRRFRDAEKLGVLVLHIRRRLLGDRHADTLNSTRALAKTYRSMGRTEDAAKLDAELQGR